MEQPGLLKIPASLRTRILRSAGVPNDCSIHINHSSPYTTRPPPLLSTRALLFTCRQLNAEVSALLYSDNEFRLNVVDPEDLQMLSALRPESVRLLKHLTVHVNAVSGLPGEPCEKNFRKSSTMHDGKRPPRPLSLRADDQEVLDEWQAAIHHVLEHAAPHRLHLHVVCDCEDIRTARHITMPILQAEKPLADCALRLSREHVPVLAHEARTVARRAMCDKEPSFPFRRLPVELQHQVLEFTDLVTPLREVEWAPRVGYHFRVNWDWCSGGKTKPYCGDFHHACRYMSCRQLQRDGCFCSVYHSAYSDICKCWANPQALFLVSHAFKAIADAVFFRQNRFVVSSRRGFDKAAKLTPRRIAPTLFITSKTDYLKYLTYLELVFPPIDHDYLRETDGAYGHWLRSIDLAACKMNLEQLTLFVSMADHNRVGMNVTHFRCNMTQTRAATIIDMYFRIIQPLAKLRDAGLKKFFVDLAWPWRWSESGRSRMRQQREAVRKEKAELEGRVERTVMGDDYDSQAMGKDSIQRSHWTLIWWEDPCVFLEPVDNSETEDDLDE